MTGPGGKSNRHCDFSHNAGHGSDLAGLDEAAFLGHGTESIAPCLFLVRPLMLRGS